MNIEELYHFLFETMPGIGVLVGAGIIISIIVCLILERKTRKRYKNHAKTEDDWSLFDDDDEAKVAILTNTGKVFCAGACGQVEPHLRKQSPLPSAAHVASTHSAE